MPLSPEEIRQAAQGLLGGGTQPQAPTRPSLPGLGGALAGATARPPTSIDEDPLIQRLQQRTEKKPGFISRAGTALKERAGELKETFGKTFRGDISPAEFGTRVVGDVVGGVGDIFGAAIEPALTPAIEKIAETELGGKAFEALGQGIENWESWKAESGTNERIAKMIESVINIGDVFGAKGLATGIKKAGKESVEKAGEFLVRRGTKDVAGTGIEQTTKRLLKAPFGAAARAGGEILGKATGAGEVAFKEVFENPKVIKFARQAGREGTEKVLDDAFRNAERGLAGLVEQRGTQYRKQLSQLDLKQNLDPVLDTVQDSVKAIEGLDTIIEGRNVVDKAIKDVINWEDATAEGLDTLKRRLQSFENQLKSADKSNAKRIVSDLKVRVRRGLNDNVEGYEQMTRAYRESSDLLDEIQRSLFGNRGQKETAARKLMQAVRRDDDTRRALIKSLETGAKGDITARIAGALLGDTLPRGFFGRIAPAAVLTTAMNPQLFMATLPFLPVFSPRISAEFVNVLGKINRTMLKNKKFPVTMNGDLKKFLKAMEEASETTGILTGAAVAPEALEAIEELQ